MALFLAILVGAFAGFWPAFATFCLVFILQVLSTIGHAKHAKACPEWEDY